MMTVVTWYSLQDIEFNRECLKYDDEAPVQEPKDKTVSGEFAMVTESGRKEGGSVD